MATRPKKEKTNEITPFQQQFIDIWFNNNFNGKLAYKKLKPDVTSETATVEASKILTLPNVQDYIDDKRTNIAIQEDIQLSWVVKELKSIVFDVKQEETERDPATGRLIAKPDRKSALAALSQLSRIAGFETKKVDITSGGEKIKIDFTD